MSPVKSHESRFPVKRRFPSHTAGAPRSSQRECSRRRHADRAGCGSRWVGIVGRAMVMHSVLCHCAAHPAQGPLRMCLLTPLAPTLGTPRCIMVTWLSVRVCCSSWQVSIGLLSTSPGSGLPGGLYLQGGAHAPQVLQVSAGPVHSLKPQASHGARTRHARHSQAAIASDTACAVNFMQPLDRWLTSAHLQRLRGAARRCAAPGEAAKWQLDVPQAYDRGRGAQVACGERRVACLCGHLAGCLCRVWRKIGDVSGAIARVSVGLSGSC